MCETVGLLMKKSNVSNITTRAKSFSTFRRLRWLRTLKGQSVKHSNHTEAVVFPPMLNTCSAPEAISYIRVSAVCVMSQVISLTEVNVSNVLLFWSFAKAAVARPGEEDAPLFVSALFSAILIQWPPWPLLPGLLPIKKRSKGLNYLVFTTTWNTHKSKGW